MSPHLEDYAYLGDGTVVVRGNPASTLTLESTGTSDSGDHYTGLDRFGRVIEQKWVRTGTPSQTTDDFVYTYDADGNTITDQHGYTMVYDAWNRLVKVEDTAANDHALLETYSYNGLGYRVLQTITPAGATAGAAAGAVAGTTAYYYSSQWQVLEERVDGATAANIQNVWSPVYVNALVCQDSLALGQSGVLGNPGTGQAQRLFIQQDANYNVTAVLALQTLPGDTNLDGTVDSTDYSTFIQHWQETVTGGTGVGDLNYDGKVDSNDYSILVQNWQATASLTWQVVQRVAYDPDGKQTVLTGNWSATPYPAFVLQSFQGGLKDQITGNINFDYRDYNPATMTWNTQDPLVFADGMNRYRAMGNNTINYTDSTGLSTYVIMYDTWDAMFKDWAMSDEAKIKAHEKTYYGESLDFDPAKDSFLEVPIDSPAALTRSRQRKMLYMLDHLDMGLMVKYGGVTKMQLVDMHKWQLVFPAIGSRLPPALP